MRRWRWWVWALVAVFVVGVAAIGIAVSGGDGDDRAAVRSGTTTEQPTTSASTTTTSTTAPSTTTPATTESTAPHGDVPGAVTVVSARAGGGSGEVALDWDAVAGATGYRVLRASTAGGPFGTAAEFDITTGTATAAAGVVNIWSDEHSYIPPSGSLTSPDRSSWFEYVDVGSGQRCFKVIAFNAAGDGPASTVACGSPP